MVTRILISSVVQLAFLVSFAATAQTLAGDLTADQLKNVVSGNTWAITFGGDLADPGLTAYWDFKEDGSVCGRNYGLPGDCKRGG